MFKVPRPMVPGQGPMLPSPGGITQAPPVGAGPLLPLAAAEAPGIERILNGGLARGALNGRFSRFSRR